MKAQARLVLSAVTCSLAVSLATAAVAQNTVAAYPVKPVRWIVPYSPGASNDITARLLAQKLTENMGQQFVVDNRPGAGGSLGAQIVVEAAADGYTLLHANAGPSINNILMRKKPPYRMNDLAPVMFIGYLPLIIVAQPAFKPNSPRELEAYAKANPGKLTWASSGNGGTLHIALALFQAVTGTNVVHVPYKGGAPALVDVMAGRVNVMYTSTVSAETHHKAGRIKIIGVAAPARQAVIPGVPTLAEEGIKGAESIVWFGVQVPAKTPRPIIAKLNSRLNQVLALPDLQARLQQLGVVTAGGSPEDMAAFIKVESDRLAMLIKTGRVGLMD